MISSLEIIECDPETIVKLDLPVKTQLIQNSQDDVSIPIHVRQAEIHVQQQSNSHQCDFVDQDEYFNESLVEKSDFYRICPIIHNDETDLLKLDFEKIASKERQMTLLQKYINDDLTSYGQTCVNWLSVFQQLKQYRDDVVRQGH